jgi:translation initiation factor IF-2
LGLFLPHFGKGNIKSVSFFYIFPFFASEFPSSIYRTKAINLVIRAIGATMSVEKVPVCCIMGQTDCGKTKLLEYMGSYDDIKKQQQQQNHGGKSAAFFPAKYIEERASAGAAAAEEREVDGPLSINLPGLLIVDISAVESDSNKRLRAWLSCDLPVLVLDIAVGVDHEIIELVKLLRLFHKDFVLVLNKVFFFFFFIKKGLCFNS